MHASIVGLGDGEVQRWTWFWDVLFPRFARGLSYPADMKTKIPQSPKNPNQNQPIIFSP